MSNRMRGAAVFVLVGVLAGANAWAQDATPAPAPPPDPTATQATDPAATTAAPAQPTGVMAPPTFHAVRGLSGEPLKLTVREAVFATVARNLDVRLRMDDREIAASEIFIQYGIYDPVLAASITKQRSENIGAFDLEGPSSQSVTTTTSEAGIAQRLPIGTLLEIAAFDQRTDLSPSSMSLNPTYDSGLGIQATQPLLQNFGTLVNNANIMIASRQLDQANLAFRRELEVRIGEVLSAYWNLDFALRNLDARVQSLVAARELERVNRARVDVGMEPMSVLLQTQADVAAREFDVADAEAQLILAQDLLLSAMAWGMEDDYKDWDRPIMPAESPSYDAEIRVSDSYAFQQALVRRPDYLSAEKDLDIADINRRVARQQRLPELNAFGGYNSTGLDDSWSGSWGDTTEMRYEGYNFGAEFRFPLFNRARRGQYRQAVDLFERAENVLLRFELQIRNEVRDSTRGIRTALVQIEASQRRVKAAEENLISETRRLEVGESTTFEVLDFQDDVAEARAAEARALADLQIALVNLGTSTSVLLDVVGVQYDDQTAPGGFDLGFLPEENMDVRVADTWKDWREMLRSGQGTF